jgi:hypothetical protein
VPVRIVYYTIFHGMSTVLSDLKTVRCPHLYQFHVMIMIHVIYLDLKRVSYR